MKQITFSIVQNKDEIEILRNLPMQKLCEKFHFEKWNNPQWKEGITYKLIL